MSSALALCQAPPKCFIPHNLHTLTTTLVLSPLYGRTCGPERSSSLSKATQLGGTDPESESGPSHFKALPSPTLLVLWASFQIINMCQHFSVLSQDILSPEFPTIFLFPSGQCLQLTRKRQQRSNQVWDSFLPGLDYCRSRGPRKLSKPFSTEENSSS